MYVILAFFKKIFLFKQCDEMMLTIQTYMCAYSLVLISFKSSVISVFHTSPHPTHTHTQPYPFDRQMGNVH